MTKNFAEFALKIKDETGNVLTEFSSDIDDLVESLGDLKKKGPEAGKATKKVGDESGGARPKVDRLSGSLEGLKGRMAGVVAAAVAVAGAIKGLGAVSETSKKFDELANNADRLGLSISELQAAQVVALRVGNVEDFTAGIDDLNERLQDFVSNGAGDAVDVLTRFNLDAEELAAKNPLDQLLSISDALVGISNNDRAQILDQLGSDNLRQLEPLLRGGREEFERLARAAIDSGAVISELDAVSLSKLGDSIKRTEENFTGLFDRLTARFAPFFTTLLDGFNDVAAGSGAIEKSLSLVGDVAVATTGVVADLFGVAQRLFKGIQLSGQTAFASILSTADDAQKGLGKLFGAEKGFFEGLSDSAAIAKVRVAETRQEIIDLANSPSPSEKLFERFALGAEKARKEVEDLKKAREDASVNTNQFERGVSSEEENDAIAKAADIIKQAKSQVAQIRADAEKEARQAQLDDQIKQIRNEQALRLKALNKQKSLESKSAADVARERIKIEVDANNRVAEIRKQIVKADLDSLNTKLNEQLKINSATQDGSEEQAKGLIQIETLQAAIAKKERERQGIAKETVRINAVLTEELLNQAAVAEKKVSDDLEKDRLKSLKDQQAESEKAAKERERLAAEAARRQQEIDREVSQARRDLLRIEGNDLAANLKDIDDQYTGLLNSLEASSEEAQIVEKLISKSKAKAELDSIQESLDQLERRFNRGEISTGEFQEQFEPQAERARSLAESVGDPQLVEDLNVRLSETTNRLDSAFQAGAVAGAAFQSNFVNAFSSILDGTKNVKEAFRDMASQILAELAKMIIQQTIFNNLAGSSGGFAGGFRSVFTGGQFHSGGAVGFGGGTKREFNPAWLGFSQVLHTGGPVLAPDEVPAVLQKGEFVLSKSDSRNPLNAKRDSGSGVGQGITINNTLDNDSVVEAINGAAGERVIQNAVRAMRDEIRNF